MQVSALEDAFMRTLDLDDLDSVSGGVRLGMLPAVTTGQIQPMGIGLPGQTFGTLPGLDPGLNFGNIGQQLPQILDMANVVLHSPMVTQVLGALTQGNPAIGQAIQGVVSMLATGNMNGLPNVINAFGQALGPQIGGLVNQLGAGLGNQNPLGGLQTINGLNGANGFHF